WPKPRRTTRGIRSTGDGRIAKSNAASGQTIFAPRTKARRRSHRGAEQLAVAQEVDVAAADQDADPLAPDRQPGVARRGEPEAAGRLHEQMSSTRAETS